MLYPEFDLNFRYVFHIEVFVADSGSLWGFITPNMHAVLVSRRLD